MHRKKKKHVRLNNSWLTDVPIGACIFFVILGIVLGNVFTIGTWYWGKPIEKADAINVDATFDSYEYIYGRYGGVSEICILFSDRDELFIDGAVYSDSIESSLKLLAKGDKLYMLLHPNSGNIWEMKSYNYTILSFDDAKSCMLFENYAFSVVLGSFSYFCSLLGALSLIVRFINYRKLKFKMERDRYGV